MEKRKGFTLIELLAVIVILAIILLISVPIILNVIESAKKGAFKNSAGYLTKAAENKYLWNQINGTEENLVYEYVNGVAKNGKDLDYKGETPKNGTIVVRKDGKVGIAIDNGKWCAKKDYDEDTVKLIELKDDNCKLGEVPEPIVNEFNEEKGVNKPQLSEGMTPIRWNGTTEVTTTEDDPEWYDYTNKKWANVKTADGSYWVWIPRYAYKITSGYHTSTAGTIDIKFLKGTTNKTVDGTIIEKSGYEAGIKDTSVYYFLHPAFTFGSDEILGFWVAKFEPSGISSNINILPNVTSLRNMTIGAQFDAAINIKNNSKYGWQPNEVDTHMMKNDEWGAVAYLSKSIYGANAEIWINPNSNRTTGCAGTSVSASSTTVCQEYNTVNGQKASTTHNITGIYDMSGGTYEYVAAYLNNGNSDLTTYGQSIIAAEEKYKNVYEVDSSDTPQNNYELNKNMFGDAIYETSLSYSNGTSWYGDSSGMLLSSLSLFRRGDSCTNSTTAGIFSFTAYNGNSNMGLHTFRPVLFVK